MRPVPLEPPDWRLGEVEAGPAARVLLLNSPHNPTGRVLDDGELERLARLCRERDLIAITDEVYEHLVYDGRHAAGHAARCGSARWRSRRSARRIR